MSFTIAEYFLLFIIYSFCGWCMETTIISIQNKRFVNRGFLIGPYCPIYGWGAVCITLFLSRFSHNVVLFFAMTILVCGVLEYLTSYAMEKLFKARWWDYSDQKFNLNGRICLKNLAAFGVLGLLVIYVLNPFFLNLIGKLNTNSLKWLAIGLASFFVIDSIISFIVIFGFRKVTNTVNSERREDNTEQITKMVRELFSQKSFLHRRFINAYPKLEAIKIKIKEIKEKIDDATNEIKEKIDNVTNDAKDMVAEKKEQFRYSINRNTRKAKVTLYLSRRNLKSKLKGKIKDLKFKGK